MAALVALLLGTALVPAPSVAGTFTPAYSDYNLYLALAYQAHLITYETLTRLWFGTPPDAFELAVRLYISGIGLQHSTSTQSRQSAMSVNLATSSSVTGTFALSSSTPGLPFVGNQMVVLATDLFANDTNLAGVALRRTATCGLDEDVFEPVNNLLSPSSVVELTGAQDYLHTLSGLTSTPDVFPEGCHVDPTLGVAPSLTAEPVGVTTNQLNLIAAVSSAGLQVTETNTTTGAASTVTLSTDPNIAAFMAVDVNGDGLNDIVASNVTDPATHQPAFAVFLNNGDGTFQAPKYTDASTLVAFTVADINGDGKPDIVYLDFGNSRIDTLMGNGDGTFQAAVGTPISTLGLGTVFITGDFNGDGHQDLLIGNQLFLGNGTGTFTPGSALPASVQYFAGTAYSAAVGDFNGDGKLDVAYSGNGAVQILLGNGNGTFTVGTRYASLSPAQQITVTDIDGDGNPDIVVGNSSQGLYAEDSNDGLSPMFQILLGRGDGTFVGAPIYFDHSSSYQSVSAVATADFTGDGKLDVLVPNANDGTVSVLPGDGTGKLGTAITSPVNVSGSLALGADMNGDGRPDLVLAGNDSAGAPTLAVLLNQGAGTFAHEQDYPLPNVPVSLAVGDFNGDGHMDVAVGVASPAASAPGPSGLYVLLGQANGTLATPVKVDSSANPVSLATGDLNGDGRTDLIVVDQGTNFSGAANGVNGLLHVYLGNANGTFTAAATPATGAGVYGAAALGDLNHDGKLDLVVGGFVGGATPSANVYTLLGNGDGTFQAAQVTALAAASAPQWLALADLNHDGQLDAIAGDPNDYTEVLLGLGNGLFAQGLLALGQQPAALGAADLLGNHYPELLIGSNNGLAVFQNSAVWPAIGGSATTTTLNVTPNPAAPGQAVTLNAAVTTTATGTPTGSVTFLDGTTTLGTAALSAQGMATLAISTLAAGAHSVTAQYGGDASFAASASGTVSLVVAAAPADFSITASPTASTVTPGASAATTLTLIPTGGLTGTVALACAGLPMGATCRFSPSSVALNGAAATSGLTISTTAMSAQNVEAPGQRPWDPLLPAGTVLAGILAPVIGRGRRHLRAKPRLTLTWIGFILLCAGALHGCGGSSTGPAVNAGTPTGTYAVTITATSGSTAHTTSYTLTVN